MIGCPLSSPAMPVHCGEPLTLGVPGISARRRGHHGAMLLGTAIHDLERGTLA